MWSAKYFDGKTSQSRNVQARAQNTQLIISDEGVEITRWDHAQLRVLRDDAISIHIENKLTDERLKIEDLDALSALKRAFPKAFENKLAKKDWRKLFLWGGGAVVSLGLIIFVLLPKLADYLAVMIPRDREVEMGRKLIGSLEGGLMETMMGDMRQCEGAEGLAALDSMFENLTARRELDYDIELYVVNSRVSNAFTFPGGQIVIFDGLLQAADSPNEVAGVLAHEIGHAEARDPLRIMLGSLGRSSILSIVLGDISGGVFAYAAVDSFINASYSQDAESNADSYAFDLLNESEIGTNGLAKFFERTNEEMGGENPMLSHFVSHPRLADRAEIALTHAGKSEVAPALTDEEWDALRMVCADMPEREDTEFLKNLKERFDLDDDQIDEDVENLEVEETSEAD